MERDILEILAESLDGVFAVDLDQRVVLWNEGARRLLGWRPEEVVGRLCFEVIAGTYDVSSGAQVRWMQDDRCARDCFAVRWAKAGRLAPSHRVYLHSRGGQPHWLNMTHVLVPGQREEATALVHIFVDVTEDVRSRETVEELARALARATLPRRTPPPTRLNKHDSLTPREVEILQLLAQGMGTRAIAACLLVSTATVRNHVQRVLSKLDVHTRLEAVAFASRRGLLGPLPASNSSSAATSDLSLIAAK